jgi:2'-5' RNA ligase
MMEYIMENKLLSILLLFDDESKERIINLKKELQIPVGEWEKLPHLTLAVYDKEISEVDIVNWAKNIAEDHASFKVELYAVGVFGQRFVFLVPNFSPLLFRMYENVHKKYDEYCNDNTSYKIGKWSPHIGIFYSTTELVSEKLKLIPDKLNKFEVNLTSLRVTVFENGKFTTLFEQDLS